MFAFCIPTLILLVISSLSVNVLAQGIEDRKLTPPHRIPVEHFNDPRKFVLIPGTEFGIPLRDLPAIRNQGPLALCQIFCSTALIEIARCRMAGKQCSSLDEIEKISVVSMLMYRDNLRSPNLGSISPFYGSGESRLHEILDKIQSNSRAPIFYSESCLPYEKFVGRQGFRTPYEIKTFFDTIRQLYESARDRPQLELDMRNGRCPECEKLLEIGRENFVAGANSTSLAQSLGEKTFNGFLFYFFLNENSATNGSCKEIILPAKPYFQHYPRLEAAVPLATVFEYIENVIRQNRPVVLASLCTSKYIDNGECALHCLLITAIKEVRSVATGETITLVRVHNSYGKMWQDEHDEGWIRLEILKSATSTFDDPNLEKPADQRLVAFAHTVSIITWDRTFNRKNPDSFPGLQR